MNRLSREKSPYLRHAAHQKIDWYPWSDEAFERAQREDKPVFLSSGATWCHWCHVMAKECFENEEVAHILNEQFISVKLDRDERPDIDRRYQQAISVMGFGSGWPLSAFLTPDKKPFFGGTYFPPEDMPGRPGFKKVLRAVIDFYRSKKEEISQYSEKLINFLKPGPATGRAIDESILNEAVMGMLSSFDPQNGGFGRAPKFPMSGAIEFLMNRYFFSKNETIGNVVKKTLEAMAKGGFHDQLGGGFHRYSTDEAWIVPHFEKMADDNAWLLRNYVSASFVFGNEYFKNVAKGIVAFLNEVLSDPDGGFYSSQDADVTPDDEGGYFTWTENDFRSVLNDEEYKVLSLHLLSEKSSMHHNESKRVLFVSLEPEGIAERLTMSVDNVVEIIEIGKQKLLGERRKREAPFVDRTLYTSLNGMLITAYLMAFRLLKDRELRDFALKSLERIIREHYVNGELFHTGGTGGLLDDYIFIIEAIIAAYEVTGESSYLERADKLMDLCIRKFWDNEGGGFFDTEEELIGLRLKSIEDISHPSANSMGIILLVKLYCMTGKDVYQDYAEKALEAFSSNARDTGIYTGYFFSAVDASRNMLKLTLETPYGSELAITALSLPVPYTSIVYGGDGGGVVPCFKNVCYEPIERADLLRVFLLKQGLRSRE